MGTDNAVVDQGTIRENKLELVERLADDLAHEIKNPLHSMVINLEVLRRRLAHLGPEPSAELLRYTSILGSELERVSRRIDLLLRMVRAPRGNEDLASLGEVMEELRELVELECHRHGATLDMSGFSTITRPDLPRSATRQMLLSLILDTLDLTPDGAALHVTTRPNGDQLRVEIFTTMNASNGGAPRIPESRDDTSFLTVARSLAARLGGHLDPFDASSLDSATADHLQVGYALTLPRQQ